MRPNKSCYIKTKLRLGAFLIIGLYLFSASIESCKKLVDVSAPVTALTGTSVYTDDGTAASVLTGVYTNMSSPLSIYSVSAQCGLSADELTLYSGVTDINLIALYKNTLSNSVFPPFWQSFYNYILTVNSAIEGLNSSTSLTPAVKQQLLGEAMFLRGFFYFYLTNLYGGVPLALSSNYEVNSQLPNTPATQVYQQIISDLTAAKSLLDSMYVDASIINPTNERLRPTKWAAASLLARVYLYTQKWDSAEMEATSVINNSSLYAPDTLNGVFLANSTEAIWQLQPVNTGWNTEDARLFLLPAGGPNVQNAVFMSDTLLSSFEFGDQRRLNWVDSVIVANDTFYYPYKYKSAVSGAPVTEYTMVLRLGEQYLVRSEAEANNNDPTDAVNDLNIIRNRAGLSNYAGATDKTSLLTAILHERQVELFTEWGHRWLDLKRTGNVGSVMNAVTPEKGGTWSDGDQLYPISLQDLQLDPKLRQNPGY